MARHQVNDGNYMKAAIALARTGLGRTASNPSVGCVIVKNGILIARARTADSGRPHAETIALANAGDQAKGATLYVTLEPCAHHGETPPCVDAIIKSGVTRVVIGITDPDPRVSGQSIEKLEQAEIKVSYGVLENECANVHKSFFTRINKKRPYITLKTACTLDGRTACASGESQWITSPLARRHVHALRATYDAILVGAGTVEADDPNLTTRLGGVEHKSVRIVLDPNMRTSVNSKLAQTAKDIPLWIFYEQKSDTYDGLVQAGAELLETPSCKDLETVLNVIASKGINLLLVEGGATIHGSFIKAGLYDELMIYRAPSLLDETAKPLISGLQIDKLSQKSNFTRIETRKLGVDVLEIYERKEHD